MTIELTHEQAAILRVIDSGIIAVDAMAHSCDLLWAYDCFEGDLTPDGHEALAAYDTKWIVAQRDSKLGQRAEFDCVISDLADQINEWRVRAEAAESTLRTITDWIRQPGELSLDGREALAAYDAKWAIVRKDDLQIAIDELDAKIRESDAKCHLYGLQSELYKLDHAREALERLQEAVK